MRSKPPPLQGKETTTTTMLPPVKPPRSSSMTPRIIPRTFSEEEASTVIVGKAPPSLEDVLSGAINEKPFDLESFMKYAERHFFSEALLFLTEVDGLRKENNLDKYEARLRYIMSEFVRRDAPSQINLGYFDRLETEKQASAVLDALSKDKATEPDRTSLDTAYTSIMTMIKNDKYSRYCDFIMVQRQLRVSRLEAQWWTKEGMTIREFFTFPSPVNTSESRLHAALAAVLVSVAAALSILLRFPWLWFYILYGFVARSLCGPRMDPQAFFVLFVMRPLVVEKLGFLRDEFVPGTPKRFAQIVGMLFVLACTILATLEYNIAMLIVSVCMLIAASMWAFFGWCFVCDIYMTFVHCQMLPSSVCEDCRVRYVKGEGPPVRVTKSNPRPLQVRLRKSQSLDRVPSRVSLKELGTRFSSQPARSMVGERIARVASGKFGEAMKDCDIELGSGAQTLLPPRCKRSVPTVHNLEKSEYDGALPRPLSIGARLSTIQVNDNWGEMDSKGLKREHQSDGIARASRESLLGTPARRRSMNRKTSKVTAVVEEYNMVFSQRLVKDFNKTMTPGSRPMGQRTSGTYSHCTYSTAGTSSNRSLSELDFGSAPGTNDCETVESTSPVDIHELTETPNVERDFELREPSIEADDFEMPPLPS